MAAIEHRIRLYGCLIAKSVQVVGTQLYRALWTKEEFPLGWPGYQEWSIAMMKTLFNVGSYVHWRNFIKLMMVYLSPVAGLQLSAVPGRSFSTKGFRRSWWIELDQELQPQNPKASIVLMYLHGGAFMAGDPLMYKPAYKLWMSQLAAQGIHMRVFAVGYPLAPENTFPVGLQGVVEAYDWLAAQLGGSKNIILGGDSAGGNLTIAALAYMRDRAQGALNLIGSTAPAGQPENQQQKRTTPTTVPFHPPLAAIMISPAIDFTSGSVFRKGLPAQAPSSDSKQDGSSSSGSTTAGSNTVGGDAGIVESSCNGGSNSSNGSSSTDTAEQFKWDYVSPSEGNDVIKLYLPVPHDPNDLAHPLISPINQESFTGLVRGEFLVVTGGCEAMVPDIARFVDKIRQAAPSVPVTHHIEKNEPHCYCVLSMDHLLEKGASVLVPFMAAQCSRKK